MAKYSKKIGVIPNDWDFVNAKDCLILESGMRPKEWVTDIDTDIPSLGGENIDENGFLIFDNIRYIDSSYYKKMKKGHIKDDDIYINKDGANTGKVAFSKIKPFKECAVNEHVFLIRNDGTFKQQYLFYCLLSNLGKQQILKKIIGSAQEGINNSFTKGIILPKPSLPEQASIANILSKVDEAIDSVKKSIEAAEKLKKSLMQNLLTGRMKPDGTLRTEEEFYEDEKFGKVPIGWEVKKVKNCFKFKNGKGNTTSNLKEIPDDEYCVPVYGGNGITGYYHSALLNKPTIIIGRVGEYCGNVFKTPEKSWVTDNAMLVSEVLMHDYNIDFFTIKLNSLNFKQYSDSTGQPKITQGSIGGIFITYPVKIEEQNNIIFLIDNVLNNIQQKQTQITTLERLKKSLMQNLLTGKVRVGEEGKKEKE